ncbi:calcium uniporter protein 2, mitochondrial-like [Silene latifolia]|uniref:calcium uniporter protein 2, mitochondrial-like n=1 Tax=Silene latifolia TaxID=37657 RepID=UPI003D773A12
MAFKKTLVQRVFNISKFSNPALFRTTTQPAINPTKTRPRPRPFHQSTETMRLFPMAGEALSETLKRQMDITRGRLNLDGLIAYPKHGAITTRVVNEQMCEREDVGGLTISEVKKVLKATKVEMITSKLRNVGKDWVTYKEFMEKLEEFCGGNRDEAVEFAKILDDCGSVIVFGNSVFLRPYQVAQVLQNIVIPPMSVNLNDPRKQELEKLEDQKAEIDQKAEALVRRELWAGLGLMATQTAAFMRLTFWELSWDVMEPICFYVTSAYFMLGYTFFLRTSKEPSFEGFFQSRFNAKQKQLMKAQEFNLERYNELRRMFNLNYSSYSSLGDAKLIKFDHYHKFN